MNVTVIIPAFNAAFTIGAAIESLLKQDYPREKIRIVVVNNHSTDATLATASKFPVEIIEASPKGRATARNAGIRASKGEFIFFMDSDCVASTNWISDLVSHLERSEADAIQGYVFPFGAAPVSYGVIDHTHLGMPFVDTKGCALRSQTLELYGIFDESLIRCEDIDLAWKIVHGGGKIHFVDSSGVISGLPTSVRTTLRRAYETAQGLHQLHELWWDRFGFSYPKIYAGFFRIASREHVRRGRNRGLRSAIRMLYLLDNVSTGVFYTLMIIMPFLKRSTPPKTAC